MIALTVLSYNGAPADGPSAQFDELGGTIGRANNNQLVLPDPERTISRVHARLVFRGGGFAIADNGSNPISINGMPTGAGREHPLKPGDRVQIGGYELEVREAGASPRRDDPFADLFGDSALGLATPAPMSAPAPAAWAAPPAAPAMAAWPSPPPPAPPRAPSAALGPGHIPDDWDPFASEPVAAGPAPPPPGSGGFDDLARLARPAESSLDELFGLGAAPLTGDPLGAAPAAGLAPNTAAHADPLLALTRTASVVPASHDDHASELNTPMPLPGAQAPRPAPRPAALPSGAVFSWDEPPRDGRIVTLPGARRSPSDAAPDPFDAAGLPAAPAAAEAPARPTGPPVARPPTAPSPRAAAPAAAAGSTDADALHRALLEGLGTPGLRLPALDEAAMRLIGELLRESMRGAVELLVARAALKRELRAEQTMIVARENNPLKFSPSVEVALQHLLGPPSPGFMAAAPAVRDAFDDLRAHQLGVMAGMRAALDGVLQRFDPEQLEAKLGARSSFASLIPATRKARLWELFQELFGQLQTEAQDDFDELFGRAFLKAYEEQLGRLRRERDPR
ncbi:MAG: type VI secretion system-associated FHA domain protein TagH [Burkholderiaceae bacterium]|jgi:type VI secretion system FHA domain protein|nr:type VI secretion system-associated FHA domain protein TagH [Burkholderiaceae bacterium]MCZ8177211.1 type VI secretion system-associated FHA domain protein TagH [Burkholderiaceae bacterium]